MACSTDTDKDALIPVWNWSEMPVQKQKSVVELFREQVRSRPDAVAVKDEYQSLSYGELDRLSNCVAHRLIREGVGGEELVALLLGRSVLFVVAALGVLKAGAAYLPLDRLNSDQRTALLLTDSEVRFVIGKPDQCNRFAELVETTISIDDSFSGVREEADHDPEVKFTPASRAYMIYTSGSTGMPKGVEIEHHSLANLVAWYRHCLSLSETDRVAMIANISFDGSVGDLWPALCCGARIVIPYGSLIADIEGLMLWLSREKITVAFIPTAILELMLKHSWPQGSALRYLITGGDTLRIRPPKDLPFILINGYGPTENTVFSTWSVVSPEGTEEYPPIGRPIGNVHAYILDDQLKPVSPGEKGELYLGGDQIARGYRNRAHLTAKVFLPDPFTERQGARMYRTGDWAFQGADGELRFLGRKDDQVQIYGHRFELGEVEQVLRGHPAVRQVCCRPVSEEGIVSGIAAHVVTWDFSPELRDGLTQLAMRALPIAAVPKIYFFYERFPMTDQGKINRQALDHAVVELQRDTLGHTDHDVEERIVALWKETLPACSQIDTTANFFELGGDSLLAGNLVLGMGKILRHQMTLMTFLQCPTLNGLFEYARKGSDEKFTPIIPFHPQGNLPPVYFLYNLSGDLGCYWNLAYALGKDQPSYGFASEAAHNLEKIPDTIEEAAAKIVQQLLRLELNQPPALIGYSWGAILAFEVARQWIDLGKSQPFVALLGAEPPINRSTTLLRLLYFIRWIRNRLRQASQKGNTARNVLRTIARIRKKGFVEDIFEVPSVFTTPLINKHCELLNKYHPDVHHSIRLELFREKFEKNIINCLSDGGWGILSGATPRTHWVDADHDHLLRAPAVYDLAIKIRIALEDFYKS